MRSLAKDGPLPITLALFALMLTSALGLRGWTTWHRAAAGQLPVRRVLLVPNRLAVCDVQRTLADGLRVDAVLCRVQGQDGSIYTTYDPDVMARVQVGQPVEAACIGDPRVEVAELVGVRPIRAGRRSRA